MHRFRKKSDAKRPPEAIFHSAHIQEPLLPTLPPASDFRTSLILPDLTRRFTLLRSSSGEPVSLDDLRTRFAEQREKGVRNQISEEEEDMLVEALSRIRARSASGTSTDGNGSGSRLKEFPSVSESSSSVGRQSGQSTISTMSSVRESSEAFGSVVGRVSKRHSNNLFAGQFRDFHYMRRAPSKNGSGRSMLSSLSEKSSRSELDSSLATGSPRPTTPESITPSASVDCGPEDMKPPMQSTPPHSVAASLSGPAGLHFAKRLSQAQLQRMSASLHGVLQELEEETDDRVLVPRSAPVPRNIMEEQTEAAQSDPESLHEKYEMLQPEAVSDFRNWIVEEPADLDYRSISPTTSLGSASPLPRVPGYIPGMPRPMTPRDTDFDDQRSHSTTPRATSPVSPLDRLTSVSPLVASSLLRRGISITSRQPPRSASPFTSYQGQRSDDGRNTPEQRAGTGSELRASSESLRTRPASPLSRIAFQPFANTSRPSTPSNVTWNVTGSQSNDTPKQLGRNGTLLSHSRQGSSVSVVDTLEDSHNTNRGRVAPTTRPLRSGAMADSPHFVNGTQPINATTDNIDISNLIQTETPASAGLNSSSSYHGIQSLSSVQLYPHASPFSQEDKFSPSRQAYSSTANPEPPGLTSQFSPLILPIESNSSRSSLISAGSSYHSWEEEQFNVSNILRPLSDADRDPPAWHEFSSEDGTAVHLNGPTQDDPEIILRQFTGLTKRDLATIQSMLLDAVQTRARSPEPRSSALRRRRPSIAQSIQSTGRDSRTTSPAPPQSPNIPTFNRSADNAAKANALLNSVVNSIPGPRKLESEDLESSAAPAGEPEAGSPTRSELSSPSRRTKDLASVLFGTDNSESLVFSPTVPEAGSDTAPLAVNEPAISGHLDTPSVSEEVMKAPMEGSNVQSRAVSPSRPEPPVSASPFGRDIMKEVQEKTEAAMAQLRKSPSYTKLPPASNPIRKRIQTQDISSPRLVQSSTSVDRIPTIPSPSLLSPLLDNRQSASKLTLRMKRFRSTLRPKAAVPTGEDATPWQPERSSPELPRIMRNSSGKFSPPATANIVDSVRVKPSDHSPPASASPSLKTFMSRFRRRGPSDSHAEQASLPSSPISSAALKTYSEANAPSALSVEVNGNDNMSMNRRTEESPISKSSAGSPASAVTGPISRATSVTNHTPSPDQTALRQFLDAADILGLDHAAVNDFLVRSHSKSSRTTVPPRASNNNHPVVSDHLHPGSNSAQTAQTSLSEQETIVTPEPSSTLLTVAAADLPRSPHPREMSDNSNNPVVRRTIIFASEEGPNADLTTLMRKTSKSHRRASGTSVQSSRSVHDRAPTPPPPIRVKRFSVDTHGSPPVPKLPSSFSIQNAGTHATPSSLAEARADKSSTYESLYDMYTGDRTSSFQGSGLSHLSHEHAAPPMTSPEPGQAVEVIEMANGETIWSIVNGLRSTDTESLYVGRSSMDSEFSAYPSGSGEKEQLFFKEHARASSKTSVNSLLGRKRVVGGANRPETKVFYSSSTQIARLIEQLSHGADAGSFNIKPTVTPGHSHTSSFQSNESGVHWTVEERLDHMLGFMNSNPT